MCCVQRGVVANAAAPGLHVAALCCQNRWPHRQSLPLDWATFPAFTFRTPVRLFRRFRREIRLACEPNVGIPAAGRNRAKVIGLSKWPSAAAAGLAGQLLVAGK